MGLGHALKQGTESAFSYMQEHGREVSASLQAVGKGYGLTDNQAKLYASSFSFGSVSQKAAIQDIREEYAQKNPDGAIQKDKTGNPVLSKEDDKFVKNLTNAILDSSDAGDQAGSYLAPVARYNMDTGRTGRVL